MQHIHKETDCRAYTAPGPAAIAGTSGATRKCCGERELRAEACAGPAGRPRAGPPAGQATPSALADSAARCGAAQDMAMMHFSPH